MSFIVGLYSFTVLYSIIILMYIANVLKNTSNYMFILLLCCNVVDCLGYMWYATADNVGEALIGMKLTYLGGISMLYFMLRIIVSVCKIKFPNWFRFTLVGASAITLYMSMMIGVDDSFYKSYELVQTENYSYMIKGYGPLHKVYLVVLFLYMVMSLSASLYSLRKPTLVSRGMASAFALSGVISICIYYIQKIFSIKMELVPFANQIILTINLIIIRRLYMYDADRAAQAENEARGETGVILFDNSKRYLGSNKVARDLFPEINEYYVEQKIPDRFNGKQYFEDLIEGYVSDEQSDQEPGVLERDGEIHKVRVRKLKYNSSKDTKGFIVTFTNDTRSQNYIRKIRQMNEELDAAARAANAANESKSNFLANMSHEIRTPINAVLGFNSIILRDTNEEKTREFARDIDSAGKSLLALINDILDFSKIEAGKMSIIPAEYHLSSLLNDCYSMLYSKIKDKGLEFKISCNEEAPSVLYGDEVRVRQVIINLLSNAVKYTESGSVELTADFEKIGSKSVVLSISVKDTGYGISEENQKLLFESFKRINEKKHRNIEGTGLGLALVKTLTELMGGEIFVESTLGEGSTFTVKIPQAVISDEPMGRLDTTEKTAPINKMDALSDTEGKILVVDDVATNLKVFRHLLAKSKLEIDTADSGMDAIKKASEKKYDIIFLDHMMPVMDGIEALHIIRDNPDNMNASTPAIMLTANAIDGVKKQYMDEGFDEYLPKPVNFNPLKDMIEKFLQ